MFSSVVITHGSDKYSPLSGFPLDFPQTGHLCQILPCLLDQRNTPTTIYTCSVNTLIVVVIGCAPVVELQIDDVLILTRKVFILL